MSERGLTEFGIVAAQRGDEVEVVLSESSQCARCGLCARSDDNSMRVILKSPVTLTVGAHVSVTFPYASRWRPILMVFVLPLVLFFFGGAVATLVLAALGAPAGLAAAASLVAALASLAGGLVAARSADRRFKRDVFEKTRIEPTDPASDVSSHP